MKFGGTSVANYEAVSRMISIVEGRLAERPVVVVSALSKVTDLLYRLADAAAASDRDAVDEMLVELRERHLNLAKQLLEDTLKRIPTEKNIDRLLPCNWQVLPANSR